jgi:predicted ATPase
MHIQHIQIHADRFPCLDRYPFRLKTLQQTQHLALESPITMFVGENGSGKSTLLRAVTRRCGVHIWADPDVPRVDRNPHEERLWHYVDVGWTCGPVPGSFFSSEHFQYFSERVEGWAGSDGGLFEYFGGKSLLTQSHGQSLMSFFSSRYRIKGLYFLDEPETALSPRRQLDLLRLLREMGKAGHAQFIVATHSPILLSCPEAVIFSFDRVPIQRITYEDTDHYRIYRDFMTDPRGYATGTREGTGQSC